jgi:hypothetical protein
MSAPGYDLSRFGLTFLGSLIAIIFFENTVYAQEIIKSEAIIPDSIITERIDHIQAAFNRDQPVARVWLYVWRGLFTGMAGLQTYDAVRTSEQRTYNIIGASESFLALATLFISPFDACGSGNDLRVLPENTVTERRVKLSKAETWLERNSRQELFGRSYSNHLLNGGIALAGGCIVAANDGYRLGLLSLTSSFIAGEIQIWTQSVAAIEANKSYKKMYKNDAVNNNKVDWFVGTSPSGFVAGVHF